MVQLQEVYACACGCGGARVLSDMDLMKSCQLKNRHGDDRPDTCVSTCVSHSVAARGRETESAESQSSRGRHALEFSRVYNATC